MPRPGGGLEQPVDEQFVDRADQADRDLAERPGSCQAGCGQPEVTLHDHVGEAADDDPPVRVQDRADPHNLEQDDAGPARAVGQCGTAERTPEET